MPAWRILFISSVSSVINSPAFSVAESIAAMRAQDDIAYLAPIRQTLEQHREDFSSRSFVNGNSKSY